ncbi:MAG: DUF255 domain-containing protein [Flavobacteriales bacterium]
MKYFLYTLLLLSVELVGQSKINWISFEQMEAAQKKQPRPVLVDVYTDWCGWCKRLDATTYADPNIVSYVNNNFYAIKFNAETHDSIVFQDKTYFNRVAGSRSTHDLAYALMGQRLSYPTTIYMNSEIKPTVIIPGYLDVNQTLPYLVYHAEKLDASANIDDFEKDFTKAFAAEGHNDSTRINWISMKEALELQKKNPKKIFIHLKNNSFVSDRVMSASAFEDASVIKELENYYCVEIDVLVGDTITFQEHTYINPNPGNGIHQIAFGLLQNQVGFPSVVIINEQQLVLAPIKQYLTGKHLEALLGYFRKNIYNQKSFADYIKDGFK